METNCGSSPESITEVKNLGQIDCQVKWHYEINQRVRRGKKTGTIIDRYGEQKSLGYYPELYSVCFDDGTIEHNFLWHGLVSI